jgi:hypothetical protein
MLPIPVSLLVWPISLILLVFLPILLLLLALELVEPPGGIVEFGRRCLKQFDGMVGATLRVSGLFARQGCRGLRARGGGLRLRGGGLGPLRAFFRRRTASAHQ